MHRRSFRISPWSAPNFSSSKKNVPLLIRRARCLTVIFAGFVACVWSMLMTFTVLLHLHDQPTIGPLGIGVNNGTGVISRSRTITSEIRPRLSGPGTDSSTSIRPPGGTQFSPLETLGIHSAQLLSSKSIVLSSLSSSWSWPIVHIVSTRFMQNQGTLVSLARSRLQLLEAICLPSVQGQTIFNHSSLVSLYETTKWAEEISSLRDVLSLDSDGRCNHATFYPNNTLNPGQRIDPLFLWVIKVDPNIDSDVLNELKAILEPVKHFVLLVGSLKNFGIGVSSGGWKDGQAGQDLLDSFRDGRVYFPDDDPESSEAGAISKEMVHHTVRRAHEARDDRVVLETRLDADDAVNLEYFVALQHEALAILMDRDVTGYTGEPRKETPQVQKFSETVGARWIYWCSLFHIQWNPSSEYYNPNDDPGLLSITRSRSTCVTPGLTLGIAIETQESEVPRYEHTSLIREITSSSNSNNLDKSESKNDCGLKPPSNCVILVEAPYLATFRSRAMTSAGMHSIQERGVPSFDADPDEISLSTELWQRMEDQFGILPVKALQAANYVKDHLVDTVRDNLQGQCTHGHSCKSSTMEKLQRTIDFLVEEVGGIKIEDS